MTDAIIRDRKITKLLRDAKRLDPSSAHIGMALAEAERRLLVRSTLADTPKETAR